MWATASLCNLAAQSSPLVEIQDPFGHLEDAFREPEAMLGPMVPGETCMTV